MRYEEFNIYRDVKNDMQLLLGNMRDYVTRHTPKEYDTNKYEYDPDRFHSDREIVEDYRTTIDKVDEDLPAMDVLNSTYLHTKLETMEPQILVDSVYHPLADFTDYTRELGIVFDLGDLHIDTDSNEVSHLDFSVKGNDLSDEIIHFYRNLSRDRDIYDKSPIVDNSAIGYADQMIEDYERKKKFLVQIRAAINEINQPNGLSSSLVEDGIRKLNDIDAVLHGSSSSDFYILSNR